MMMMMMMMMMIADEEMVQIDVSADLVVGVTKYMQGSIYVRVGITNSR
jgi:hypothetical protein